MGGPVVETVSPDRTVAVLTVSLAGDGTNSQSSSALAALRDQVVPATIGKVPGTHVYVGGTTAGSVDFSQTMAQHLPYVFAFVLGMAFLLLLLSFRSVVVALLTIVLNLLSVGAAYGLMVLVFQDGFGRSLLGAADIGGVVNWIPLFLLVILFGLSMDYHVLVLSRIREGRDTRPALRSGPLPRELRPRPGVITSAALVMVAVFAIFATLERYPVQATRRGPGGGRLHRRHHRPGRAPALGHEIARRVELVPSGFPRRSCPQTADLSIYPLRGRSPLASP